MTVNDTQHEFLLNALGVTEGSTDDLTVIWLRQELSVPGGQINDLERLYRQVVGPLPWG